MMAPWAPLDRDEGFYVTIKRDSRTGVLLGPFATHELSLLYVDTGRELAIGLDRMATFDAFGTTRVSRPADGPLHDRPLPAGRLNKLWEERYGHGPGEAG
jgi:hypothetical protein